MSYADKNMISRVWRDSSVVEHLRYRGDVGSYLLAVYVTPSVPGVDSADLAG